MLHTIISEKVGAWFQREDCPAKPVISHIEKVGFFRDAQIEAIKTYLFLKIEGGNRPLWQLLCDGFLTPGEDLSRLHISEQTRNHLEANKPARALFEFSRLKKTDSKDETLLPELEKYLLDYAAELDCGTVIKRIFYGVEYPDYLFSLPMGAGKTFLMAAFIYLDLYFAQLEPENKTFAHNFVLLVPSGLKSSILPSLKTIENFDPVNVLPEPAASTTRKLIRFEILDQPKSGKKNNRARNPNAQKISQYQPFDDLMGLVMVTNAEKVVLDQAKFDAQGRLFEQTDDEKDKAANELRNLIGKIPNLQILIDEVHHAATDDIKLRQVVNSWNATGTINGVLGFSGTPYLSTAESVRVAAPLSLKFAQITNTVFHYPLTRAIATFLKKPAVRILSQLESREIVRRGVEEFLQEYGSRTYEPGQTAKLAIYCGTIERLEEDVYPMLIGEMGIPPDDILKYHQGNAKHKIAATAQAEWRALDTPLSRKRIVLLVQIGKEGWDCRSLTGVILSQKGDCPTNMVLQTSCRCLRQMDGGAETAGIWLNADNAKILDKQLREEQHTSIAAINNLSKGEAKPERLRFSRVDALKLPPVDFYQLRVQFDTVVTEEATPGDTLGALDVGRFRSNAEVVTRGLQGTDGGTRRFLDDARGDAADFSAWMLYLSKSSFGAIPLSTLRSFEKELRPVFDAITYDDGGIRRFNALYDAEAVAAEIRLAFYGTRQLQSKTDVIDRKARLLVVENLKAMPIGSKPLYPGESDVEEMRKMDAAGQTAEAYVAAQREQFEKARELLKAQGLEGMLSEPNIVLSTPLRHKDRSFHYVPYQFDSNPEVEFLREALGLEEVQRRNLELYFNGEGEITEFRILCYAKTTHGWNRVGLYTPDFLLIERRGDAVYRALIIEMKGSGFADQAAFKARRTFVESEFLKLNNEKFGYNRFAYLYLTDANSLSDNLRKLQDAATSFFTN